MYTLVTQAIASLFSLPFQQAQKGTSIINPFTPEPAKTGRPEMCYSWTSQSHPKKIIVLTSLPSPSKEYNVYQIFVYCYQDIDQSYCSYCV